MTENQSNGLKIEKPAHRWDVFNDNYNKVAAMWRAIAAKSQGLPADVFGEMTPGHTLSVAQITEAIAHPAPAQHPAPKRRSLLPWLLGGAIALGGAGTAWYALRPGTWIHYTWDGQTWKPDGTTVPGTAWREPK